jgi:phage tail-like protein
MAAPSSYLRFLPPALYRDDPADPAFSLGGYLRIVEKILTGIDDQNVVLGPDGKPVKALQQTIAQIAQHFDPWRTPPDFLDYVASWVTLALPPGWNEYQKRKLLSEIVGIYQRRSSRESLLQFMDAYTVADKRPVVAIDEGGQVFRATPTVGAPTPIESFVPHSTLFRSPVAIAAAPDNTMFVADLLGAGVWHLTERGHNWHGVPLKQQIITPVIISWSVGGHVIGTGPGTIEIDADVVDPTPFPHGLWFKITQSGILGTAKFQISKDGGANYGAAVTIPVNGNYGPDADGIKLTFADNGGNPSFVADESYLVPVMPAAYVPACVAVDFANPYHVYMLNLSSKHLVDPALHRATSPDFDNTKIDPIATATALKVQWPVAMLFQPEGKLMILDRGISFADAVTQGKLARPKPKIIEVTLNQAGLKVQSVIEHSLAKVYDPVSFCQLRRGALIVGDARDPATDAPGDLVLVSPARGWSEERLLDNMPAGTNPLLAPTGLTRDDDQHFYVADLGLRPHNPWEDFNRRLMDPNFTTDPLNPSDEKYNPFVRTAVNPPALYRVDISGQPVITQVSEAGRLTRPSSLVLINGTLYVADQGLFAHFNLATLFRPLPFGIFVAPSSFNVEVNFSKQYPTTQRERREIIDTIEGILQREKPVHTTAFLLALA